MADTDASGLVYHANYLAFAERARTEMLREAGITQAELIAGGEGFWAVAEADIRYRRPARLDELLTVVSRPTAVGAATVRIEQRILREEECLVELEILAAFLAPDGRPKRQPADWRERFGAIAAATKEAW